MGSPLSQDEGEVISHIYIGSPLSQDEGEVISCIYMGSPLGQEACSHVYMRYINIYSCHCFSGLHSAVKFPLMYIPNSGCLSYNGQ